MSGTSGRPRSSPSSARTVPRKQEVDAGLLAYSKVVVGVLDQAATIDDLRAAIAAGSMTPSAVLATRGDIVVRSVAGRDQADDTCVFESAGTALQDVVTASLVYERAG